MGETQRTSHRPTRTSGPLVVAQRLGGMAGASRLLTPAGYCAIETLRQGDAVATLIGRNSLFVPIVWIGLRQAADRAAVRIRAAAIGDAMPSRDLLLAPDHAIYIDGTLYRAGDLVNGLSIRHERQPRAIDWWGVRLQRHDVLVAENLPIESVLDPSSFTEVAEPYQPSDGVVRMQPAAPVEAEVLDFPSRLPWSIRWFRRRLMGRRQATAALPVGATRQAGRLLSTTVERLDLAAEGRSALAGLADLAAQHRVQLEIAVEPGLEVAIAPRTLHEVLDILLVHAMEAAPGGRVLLGAMHQHQRVHIAVVDDGAGRSAEVQQAELRRVEETVALLGGRMEIDSRAGEGTTVLLRLPALGERR